MSSEKTNENYEVLFDTPKKRLPFETRSKFLRSDSDLYFFVKDCQDRIKYSGWRITDKLEPCVEILSIGDKGKAKELDTFLRRVLTLEGLRINITDRSLWSVKNKKIYLKIAEIDNKEYSIQIAAFTTACINLERFLNIIFKQDFNYGGDFDESGASTF